MATQSTFTPVPEQFSFPQEEEKILKFWEEQKAFETSLKKSEGKKRFTFYDGPPFATGLPHYGHIAAGTIKDVVCRYAHMTDHYVERRFGWDCHGLPIEYEIDKTYNINSKTDIESMGVAEYNSKCRAIVMRYSSQWKDIVTRLGRWIDFENDYKTMDLSFMESVWWVFKTIYDNGLVYRSCKVMPYSTACSTVISNFEANQNYLDTVDPSIYVTFPLEEDPQTCMVAWTTTPWTLPSNLGVAVNPSFTYVKVKDKATGKNFIVFKDLLDDFYKITQRKQGYEKLEEIKGEQLDGKPYIPLFNFFEEHKENGCFRVMAAKWVTASTGTGVVHCAPAFGDDDFRLLCVDRKVVRQDAPPDPLDANGRFKLPGSEIDGMYLKDADKTIKEILKKQERLLYASTIKHSYPFCWRSNTPLIYRAFPCWFIKVEAIKEELLANNMKARWVPPHVQEKRFHNWLQDAQDWCFSRNRCWGNPIPLWVSDDFEEVVCVGSIEELKRLTGVTEVTDMHRESLDGLTIPSQQGKGVLRRIEEVFDCWFESGSMPFAQSHYPFAYESEEQFLQQFPADFVGEGLDQTRGWFYTLNVISTAVMKSNPFKNLIANGLVLAQDGSKMSKSKKNYPDPKDVVDQFGADAVRLYLMESPLVRAEPLKFNEKGVQDVIREVFLPWLNAYRFLIQNAERYEKKTGQSFRFNPESKLSCTNAMDKWITAALQNLIKYVHNEMNNYKLYTVSEGLVRYLGQLTNWYVRLNRLRLKGNEGAEDWLQSLNILFESIYVVSLLMAPFTPFLSEEIYQNLKQALDDTAEFQSIHYRMLPTAEESLINEAIEKQCKDMQGVIEQGRFLRDKHNIPLRRPVSHFTVIHHDPQYLADVKNLEDYIKTELNINELIFEQENSALVQLTAKANSKQLGQRLQKQFNKQIMEKIKSMSQEEVLAYESSKTHTLQPENIVLQEGDIIVERNFLSSEEHMKSKSDGQTIVVMNTELTPELEQTWMLRELTNRIQKARKEAGLKITDTVQITLVVKEGTKDVVADSLQKIQEVLLVPVSLEENGREESLVTKGEFEMLNLKLDFFVNK